MPGTRAPRVVTPAPEGDRDLVDLLASGLADNPPYLWLITDYATRRDLIPAYFAHEIANARRREWLLRTVGEPAGLAVWGKYAADADDPPACGRVLAEVLGERLAEAFAEFEDARHAQRVHTMAGCAHLHLRTLCARFPGPNPTVEKQLLNECLEQLDAERLPTYADPSRPDLRALLEGAGFLAVETLPAGGGTAMFHPMVREPA